MTLLKNAGFEQDWGDERSHNILRIPESGVPEVVQLGNVFSPPGWLPFFRHIPGWDQPEIHDAHRSVDPHRVRSGEKAILLFTFGRKHDAGFLQQVAVTTGTRLRFSAYLHAWSNHNDVGFPHPNDGRWSEGAGYEEVAWTSDEIPPLNGDQQNDAKGNFLFCVGIDPAGGTNPLADTVEWGDPLYCYNGYTVPVTVEATARADTVTVFVRSITLWAFKHNDMYLDDAELVVVADPPPPPDPDPPLRGHPREDYERTYLLLPPAAGEAWAAAAVDATWDAKRWTIGGSADDAGIGDLSSRTVIAVNPDGWPDDLRAFFAEWYPGVVYVPIYAETPAELYRVLTASETNDPPLVRVGFNDPDAQGAGDWMLANGVRGPLCVPLFLGETARVPDFMRYADAGIQVYINLRYSWSVDKGGAGTLPPFADWQSFADACVQTIRHSRGVHGWTIGNEVNNPREFPRGSELTPHYVAAIYNYIADAVDVRLSPGAIDPFFGPGSSCRHWFEVIWERVHRADFIDVHGYIRGPDADLCWSGAKFTDDPLKWQYLNYLKCITSLLTELPQRYAELPVLVSEFNHIWRAEEKDIGWVNDGRASHVVRSASAAAQEWNERGGRNPIAGLCVYRWRGDEWEVYRNPHVLDAVAGLALIG